MKSNDFSQLKKDFDKLEKNLEKAFAKNSKAIYNKIGKEIREMIVGRWQDGMGVKEHEAKASKLKDLKPSTIKSRTYKAKKGKLDSRTKPDMSNLIDSGKTIDSINYYANNEELIIGSKTREEIIGYNEEKDRAVLYLSNIEAEKIQEIVDKEIDDIFNKTFK